MLRGETSLLERVGGGERSEGAYASEISWSQTGPSDRRLDPGRIECVKRRDERKGKEEWETGRGKGSN